MRRFLFLFFCSILFSQNQNNLTKPSFYNFGIPLPDIIYYNFEPVYQNNQLLTRFHFNILNDVLSFVKIDSMFEAQIELSIKLIDDDSIIIQTIEKINISVNKFAESNQRNEFFHFEKLYNVAFRPFKIELKLLDLNSNKKKIIRENYYTDMSNWSIFKLSPFYFASSTHFLVNQDYINYNEPFYLCFYNKKLQQGDLKISIKNIATNKIYQNYNVPLQINNDIIKIEMPYKKLQEGPYQITAELTLGPNTLAIFQKDIHIIWWRKPESLYVLDLAYRPFKILLDSNELNTFDLLVDLEKRQFFYNFWSSKSITEQNLFNPLLTEFYERVDYVTNQFSTKIKVGWESDRGKTYLLNGKPISISIEHRENGEFLIWNYNNYQKIFIFDSYKSDYFEYEN
jgi:GWxTD domain-containing protein